MARVKTMKVVITFPGTTQALRMEKEARERGLAGRLIPGGSPGPIRLSVGDDGDRTGGYL